MVAGSIVTLIGCDVDVVDELDKRYPAFDVLDIALVEDSFNDTYSVGDEFAGAVLMVTHSDNEVSLETIGKLHLTGFDTTSPGKKSVEIVYSGHVIKKTIKVSNSDSVSRPVSIDIVTADTLFNYKVGQPFYSGKLKVEYAANTTTIDLNDSMLSEFDTTTVGLKHTTVYYDGCVTEFYYNVTDPIKEIKFSESFKKSYVEGSDFEEGGMLIVEYYNGSEIVFVTYDMTSGFGTELSYNGKTVYICYKGWMLSYELTITSAP